MPSAYLGKGLGHLHELPDQLATMRTVTKWAQRIDHPAQAPRVVAEAFARHASAGRSPVALSMPWEVFDQRAPSRTTATRGRWARRRPTATALERRPRLLAGARQPLIMVGGGAQHASAEVLELAEHLQAPVVAFRGGRGIVSSDHPLG